VIAFFDAMAKEQSGMREVRHKDPLFSRGPTRFIDLEPESTNRVTTGVAEPPRMFVRVADPSAIRYQEGPAASVYPPANSIPPVVQEANEPVQMDFAAKRRIEQRVRFSFEPTPREVVHEDVQDTNVDSGDIPPDIGEDNQPDGGPTMEQVQHSPKDEEHGGDSVSDVKEHVVTKSTRALKVKPQEQPKPPEQVVETAEKRYPQRSNRTTWRDRVLTAYEEDQVSGYHDFILTTQHELSMQLSIDKAIKQWGAKAEESIDKELQQFIDLEVWEPVQPAALTPEERKRAIWSLMFLKEKFRPDGSFEKLKARLVANGNQMDREIYDEVSSPTVSYKYVMVVAAIAALEGRIVVSGDVPGAYLRIRMRGPKVYVRLRPDIASRVVRLHPAFAPFVQPDGTLWTELKKAMYGCLQCSLFLYEYADAAFKAIGLVPNQYDQCVYNMGVGVKQCTVCLYVDDLMVTCADPEVLEGVLRRISEVFPTLSWARGKVHNYVGCTFDWSTTGVCKVTMSGYIDGLLAEYKVAGTAVSPATDKLFEYDESSPALSKDQKASYRRLVAQLLYLSKRLRGDLSVALARASTRVEAPTQDDWGKLVRVLKYLNGTKELALYLGITLPMVLCVWIDAAYGVHADGKSHTGAGMSLGRGFFGWRSVKQRIVTKSSTEAELVADSDYLGESIETKYFLEGQGYEIGPIILWQDNKSCILLMTKGRTSADRTRHINIRYFWMKDLIKDGLLVVRYLPTGKMTSDMFTKPMSGNLLLTHRATVLGHNAQQE
jgi:hypothetical protein